MTVDGLAGDVSPHAVVTDKEVLGVAGVAGVGPLVRPHLYLEPTAAHVSGVTPQHLSHQHRPGLRLVQAEAVHDAGLECPDVAVPEVLDDLGEVDVLRQSPGHILTHAWRMTKLTGRPLDALLVEDLGVVEVLVEDHGALVSPDLRHLRQLVVPLERRQAGQLGGGHTQLASLYGAAQLVMSPQYFISKYRDR